MSYTSILASFFGTSSGPFDLPAALTTQSAQQLKPTDPAMRDQRPASLAAPAIPISLSEGGTSSITADSVAAAAAMYYRHQHQQQQQQQQMAKKICCSSGPIQNPVAASSMPGTMMAPLPSCNVTSLYGKLRTSALTSGQQAPSSASTQPAWCFGSNAATGSSGDDAAGPHMPAVLSAPSVPASNSNRRLGGTSSDWVALATSSSAAVAAAAAAASLASNAMSAGGSAPAQGGAPSLDMPNAELLSSLLSAGNLRGSLATTGPATSTLAGPATSTLSNTSSSSFATAPSAATMPGIPCNLRGAAAPGSQAREPPCMLGTLAATSPGCMAVLSVGGSHDSTLMQPDQRTQLLQQLQLLQDNTQRYGATAAATTLQPVTRVLDGFAITTPVAAATQGFADHQDSTVLASLSQQLQALAAADALAAAGAVPPAGMLLLDHPDQGDTSSLPAFATPASAFTAASMPATAATGPAPPGLQAYLLQDVSADSQQQCKLTSTAPTTSSSYFLNSPAPGASLQQCMLLHRPLSSAAAAGDAGFTMAADAAALQQAALPCVTPGASLAGCQQLMLPPCSNGGSVCTSSNTTNSNNSGFDGRLLQGAATAEHHSSAAHGAHNPLYKTELCRSWQDTSSCRYGARCQFAHGSHELRPLVRHPKYRTQPCRTFSLTGKCPYGDRCTFIHDLPPGLQLAASNTAGSTCSSTSSSAGRGGGNTEVNGNSNAAGNTTTSSSSSSRGFSFSSMQRSSSSGVDAAVIVTSAAEIIAAARSGKLV